MSYQPNFKCDRCGQEDIKYTIQKDRTESECSHCGDKQSVPKWEDEIFGMDREYRDRMFSFVEGIRHMMGHGYGEGDLEHMLSIVIARNRLYDMMDGHVEIGVLMGDPKYVRPEYARHEEPFESFISG